jgi:hypothetical protein
MINSTIDNVRASAFTELFLTFTPRLVSFFRSHGCGLDLSEDLSQEVMLTVYRNQRSFAIVRDFVPGCLPLDVTRLTGITGSNLLKRSRLILRTCLIGGRNRRGRQLSNSIIRSRFLKSHEGEALILRFVEDWEYHEIAAATASPIGTIQWRVFNAKKKLAIHLKAPSAPRREAA